MTVQDRIPTITSSPQFHDRANTANIMWAVVCCLLPAALWGVYVFGFSALQTLALSIVVAVATEAAIGAVQNKFTINDGSAVLTGLLIGMNMPASVPFFIPAVASFFAIAVVKWSFGGLGRNWMNPALAGRLFVFFSWSKEMTGWTQPSTIAPDALSAASPLGFLKTGMANATGPVGSPVEFLAANGFPRSAMDTQVSSWLNTWIFGPLGISMPQGYVDLFMGNIPGCIGEVSALLLLAGTIYLFARDIITWEIPVSYFASFGLLVWVFGGLPYQTGLFSGDVLFHIFTGGMMLGVFYMATDMVTSPLTRTGQIIFGIGCGALTYLIRFFGSLPEGVSLAIVLMNITVPLINRLTQQRRFGLAKGD